jgi:tetratricopeptide (TPR) repeat protein
MSFYRPLGSLLLACLALTSVTASADALTDAKRRAASELLKEGKTDEAVAMLQEVVRAEPGNYKDHLALARAYDKLGRAPEAAESYHAAADALATARPDDRPARAEIDRRLKILDAQTAKIAAAEADFLKRLDALERDAVAAQDMRALRRVFALRGGVWNARGRREGFGVELSAAAVWLDAGAVGEKGATYRVRAAGVWTIDGARCTADGTPDHPATVYGPYGCLLAQVEGGGRTDRLGVDTTFVAPATGRMLFISNARTQTDRARSTGDIYILVTRVPPAAHP